MSVDLRHYNTDKSPEYLANYDRELGHLYRKPITMLELGIQHGGSLRLWLDLFPQAQIAGLDLNPVEVLDDSGRLHVYTGFQQDPVILDEMSSAVAPDGFDLIIDDASHLGVYTKASFWHLFPRMKPGGIYVLDDWSSGYWSHWPDGHAYSGDREALGESPTRRQPRFGEGTSRRVRVAARPVAKRLSRFPVVKSALEGLFMRAEGATIRRRFPSHEYGMVGFVKQLVDACALDVIDRGKGEGPAAEGRGMIASVHVTESQVFVHKRR